MGEHFLSKTRQVRGRAGHVGVGLVALWQLLLLRALWLLLLLCALWLLLVVLLALGVCTASCILC